MQLKSDTAKTRLKIDEDSFLHLYECYWKKLYHLAYKYLGDVYKAEGLVQEVFISIWQRKDQIALDRETIENYLVRAVRFRIARNFSDQARKIKRSDELSIRQQPLGNATEQQILYSFLKEEIDKLVNLLPQRCKAVYKLSRNQGLNNKEIALDLQISEKTVENQLTKALKFLRKGLSQFVG